MFKEIFRFEWRQQTKSPLFWLIALMLCGIALAATASNSVSIGGGIGNIHRNAPFTVINTLGIFSVLGLFLIPIFVAGGVLRDFAGNTAEMIFATPISRRAYLGGRFAAGWVTSALVMVAVALGMWLGSFMPWLDPARLGPTPLSAYAWAFAVLVLPNLFFLSTLLVFLATLTRSMLATYAGVLGFFVLWLVANLALGAGNIAHQTAASLIDPFGLGAFELGTRYWTAADRNTRVPEITGVLLLNRAIWSAAGVTLLAGSIAWFRFDREGLQALFKRRRAMAVEPSLQRPEASTLALPKVRYRADGIARWVQVLTASRFETASVLRGTAFLVMMGFGLLNLTGSLFFAGQMYGTSVYPVTHLMAQSMGGSYKWLLWIILGFYAGELAWRERGARVHEITDAFPIPDWVPLLAKVVALAAAAAVFLSVGALYCIGFQLVRGYDHLQPMLYLQFIGLDLLRFIWFAILAIVLQSIANSKFVGYGLLFVFIIGMISLAQFHLADHLYLLGSAPATPYSDMNGFGSFWIGNLWFRAYWYCFAIALLVVANLFWMRGNMSGWAERWKNARCRFRTPARVVLTLSLLGFAVIGIYNYHNTHGLYRYQTYGEKQRLAANYEKKYRRYLYYPQPRITDVNVNIAMHPEHRVVDVDGHYVLVNKHLHPIDQLLVQLPVTQSREFHIKLDFPAHTTVIADKREGFYLYRLDTPLAVGASMQFKFLAHMAFPGFSNEPTGEQIVGNGTFFDNEVFPHFCYDAGRQLTDNNRRREYGLGAEQPLPSRNNMKARGDNLVSCDADWVHFQATLSTRADQIALAPGYLTKEWVVGGRRYFRYVQDTPILDFFSFQSARYLVARQRWKNVNLEVYYDRHHQYNVQRILDAMKHALNYYTKNFGPYQFRQLRIVEFPDYAGFAQSFANTVPFTEDFVLEDLRKPTDIDYITYVTAHETAHQWWAHQAIGGDVRGVTMLDESLAQYSSLMVMKHLYGPNAMRKFLKYELDRYLAGRANERNEEEPLAKVNANQDYIHYHKGALIFYALQDYIGEAKVNAALRIWLHQVKYQAPPYTDTHDLIADLRAQAGPAYQNLITDFFDRITLFDDRMVSATAKKLGGGRYLVTMHVHAAKYYADGKGKETRAKVDIPIEIGVFARAKNGEDQDEKPLYLAKYPVRDGNSTITVTVTGRPYQAGIDPYNELIDRVSGDNRTGVTIQ